MTLSEKIYACRKKAGLSQDALAEKLGVSRQAVSKWETGEATPEVGKLLALAQAFHVTTDWLLSVQEDMPPEPSEGREKESGLSAELPKEVPPPERPMEAGPEEDQQADTWVDHIPGLIGRLIRQYGWLYGVWTMAAGALFLGMGALMRSMIDGFNRMADGMGLGMGGLYVEGIGYLDEAGRQVSGKMGIGGFVMCAGGVIFVVGLCLTVFLFKKRNEKK